ncbi:MAG: Ppx/GppA phosphatase family protein [Polyangiaceae bacterium]
MKLAAIDIGSNSIHMIVAEATASGSFEVIDREKEMVFLGRSVFEHGRLTDEAVSTGLAAVSKFHKLAQRHGVSDILAVATSATREAENGGEFLYSIADTTGIVPQVISGEEEARYIYLSVRNAVDLIDRRALVLDIGGGSVETVVGDARQMEMGLSLKLGVQRLRAQFGMGAALSKKQRKELEDHVASVATPALTRVLAEPLALVVGTSGTILALGQAARLASGAEPLTTSTNQVVKLSDLAALTDRLISATPQERAAIPGIDQARADSIHLGAVLLTKLLELAKADRITLCDAALREGLVLDFLQRKAERIRAFDELPDIRRRSVLELAERCGQSGPHPERVARLALQLFDGLAPLHELTDTERKLLEFAAILHDVGQHIGYEKHEHHAAYIIMNGDLRGFDEAERQQLAMLARYHRKARPRRKDLDYASLPPKKRRAVAILAGILRVADGLDRSHHQLVTGLSTEVSDTRIRIVVGTQGDAELELWGARRKAKLLSRALKLPVVLDVEDVSPGSLQARANLRAHRSAPPPSGEGAATS